MAQPSAAAPAPDDRDRQWHRLFGLLLTDYLSDSPFSVEVEKDLSVRVQRLDVVVVRRRPGELTRPLPDGLDDFVAHNLISFKSFREPLDDWALKELTGHYVNYRKQVSPKQGLLPESDFRLYAVCARHPRELIRDLAPAKLQDGVYHLARGTDVIRIVVARDLPQTERNALLYLFSAAPAQVQYGAEHYRLQTRNTSSIVNALFEGYQQEGLTMPYTMDDFVKDFVRSHLHELPVDVVMNEFRPEERLAGLKAEERLAGLKAEERLAGLPKEQIEAYLNRLRRETPAPSKRLPKKRR